MDSSGPMISQTSSPLARLVKAIKLLLKTAPDAFLAAVQTWSLTLNSKSASATPTLEVFCKSSLALSHAMPVPKANGKDHAQSLCTSAKLVLSAGSTMKTPQQVNLGSAFATSRRSSDSMVTCA